MSMLCDAFNIPLIVFEDVPRFLPGVGQSTVGSFGTVRNCFTPSLRRRFRGSPSSSGRPMAGRTI